MTQSGHRAPLAPGEIRTAIVGDRTFQVMHVAGGSYTQASVRRNGWSPVVLKTDPSSYVAVHAYADAVEQAESDAIEGDDAPQFIGAASGELVVPGLAPAPGGMSEVHAFGRNAAAAARAALCGDLGSTRGPADVVTCPNCRALLQAGSDAAHAIEGTAPVPLYPKGTPEYDAYATELKAELAKWAAGEEPYPYRPGHPLADREPAPPWRCPTCGSRQPSMHPAVSGGEVTHLCLDPFHGAAETPEQRAGFAPTLPSRGDHLIHDRYENDPIERERRALVNPDTYRQCLRRFMPDHEEHTDGITAECHLTPPCPREDHAHLAADSMECFDEADEALPEGAIGNGVGGTCLNMGAGHETHGYARFGQGCVPTAPAQSITADDEPKWRVIITDSESLTGVAPVCDSPEHAKYARRSGMDEGNTGPDWVFDCCPHPQIELWGEANAILVAEIFNQAGAGLAGA